MDFDENLMKLHGALLSIGQRQHYDRDEVSKIFSRIFNKRSHEEKSRMVFFLLLSTRLERIDLLKEDVNVGFLTDIGPNLDLPQLADIILDLNLLGCTHEIIKNIPGVFSCQLLESIGKNLSIKSSYNVTHEIGPLLSAIFERVVKIKIRQLDDYFFPYLVLMYAEYLDFFCNHVFSQRDQSSSDFFPVSLKSLLDSFLFSAQLLRSNSPIEDNPAFRVNCIEAKINNSPKKTLTRQEKEFTDEDIGVFLCFLDGLICGGRDYTCEEIIKEGISGFLTLLSEKSENFGDGWFDRSEFKEVSETAYLLCQEIADTPMEPPNFQFLRSISKKPETELDEIEKSDIDKVIEKVRSGKCSKAWFSALIGFIGPVSKDECINCIRENLDLSEAEHLKLITEKIEENCEGLELSEPAKKLYLEALKKLPLDDQLYYFNRYFKLNKGFGLETSSFSEELTLKFNKLLNSNLSNENIKSDFISFTLQSPLKTILEICKQALTNPSQLMTCIDHLSMLESACFWGRYDIDIDGLNVNLICYVFHCILETQNKSEKEMQNFIVLITNALKRELVNAFFIEKWTVGIVKREMTQKNKAAVIFPLQLLKACFKLKSFDCNKAVLLASLSQLLSHASWDCSNFTVELAEIRELVISIISFLIKTLKPDDSEIYWLRRKIMKSSEVNRLYFCDLWYRTGCNFVTSNAFYIQLLILLHSKSRPSEVMDYIIGEIEKKQLSELRIVFIAALIRVLPILTCREWISLFSHSQSIVEQRSRHPVNTLLADSYVEAFNMFTAALYCIGRCSSEKNDMIPCFTYCIRNFGVVIQEFFLSGVNLVLSADICLTLAKGIMYLLHSVDNPSTRKYFSLIIYPILLDVFQKGKEFREQYQTRDGYDIELLEKWFKKDFI